jgi:hypothetical protein
MSSEILSAPAVTELGDNLAKSNRASTIGLLGSDCTLIMGVFEGVYQLPNAGFTFKMGLAALTINSLICCLRVFKEDKDSMPLADALSPSVNSGELTMDIPYPTPPKEMHRFAPEATVAPFTATVSRDVV